MSATDPSKLQRGAKADAPPLSRSGLIYALAAYFLWGGLPLFFLVLAPAGPFEIVGWRILFSLVFCVILLAVTRGWGPLRAIMRRPKTVLTMGLAGVFIYFNWTTFVIATVSGNVVEAALGYFINPIVTVLLGVILLRERLRVAQWIAIGIAFIAVIVIAVGYGEPPWMALILAASFGLYGLVKKQVGRDVDAVSGLTLETLWIAPIAVVQLLVVGTTTGITFASDGPWHAILLALSGVITAVPLLLFAASARRLALVHIGFVQFFTPILQFLLAVFILHENMPPERLFGFALVWVALVILSLDLWRSSRSAARLRANAEVPV